MFGKVSKLSPVPSLAKLSGSKGTPPTSSKPVALRTEAVAEDCAGFCTNAEDDAARDARRAAVNLVMVTLLIQGTVTLNKYRPSSLARGGRDPSVKRSSSNVTLPCFWSRRETKDLLQLDYFDHKYQKP